MYKRRVVIFLILVGGVFCVLIGNLAALQLGHGPELRARYEELIQSVQPLPAMRGQITDRNGRILAVDKPCKDLCLHYRFLVNDRRWVAGQVRRIARDQGLTSEEANVVYQAQAHNTWKLAERIAWGLGLNLEESVSDVVSSVERIRASHGGEVREQNWSHPVLTGLDDQTVLMIEAEIQAGRTVGATVVPSHQRFYPYGEAACHILGVTGPVTAENLDRHNIGPEDANWLERLQRNYRAGDVIGQTGMEKLAEQRLRGQRGYRRRKWEDGRYVDLEVRPPADGKDVHLTLDIKLQELLTDRLRQTGRNGALVVLSVPTGEVLAAVSIPTYDLNRYRQDYSRLATDEMDLPLRNRAVTQLYPPGSTAKPVTALCGLTTGRITTQTSVDCIGYFRPNKPNEFRCAARSGHGPLDVLHAIMKSCNVFFFTVGDRVGGPTLTDWFCLFGYDRLPGTGLPEEVAGVVPTADWLRRKEGRGFYPSDAWLTAIGQGYLLGTPLHVANEIATVARGGPWRSPMLSLECAPPRQEVPIPSSRAHFDTVRKGMRMAVAESGGTLYRVFRNSGVDVEVCGKTGTAQCAPQRVRGEIVREGDMAWTAGFAPYRNPKIAFAIVVEYVESGGGGTNAGPVAVDVIKACKEFGYLD